MVEKVEGIVLWRRKEETLQNPISNKRTWIWLPFFIVLFVFTSYFIFSHEPKKYPIYVSESPSPTGVKAFYTYLNKEKESVKRWAYSPNQLPGNSENQILVMVEPYFFPENEEMEAYKTFMEAGNTILLFMENPQGMFDLSTVPIGSDSFVGEVDVNDQNGAEYRAELTSTIRLQTHSQDKVLLYDDAGPIALMRSFGDGQLIVSNSPQWITNGNILTADHIPLVLSFLHEGKANSFLFDEYIHGGKSAAAIIKVYPKWFLLLMVQGGLLTILWLWHRGKRFGPIFIPREETVRFSDEGITALAAWYLKGRRYHDSLVIQADYVKHLLHERWRIPFSKEWMDFSVHLERKWPQMDSAEVQALLKSLTHILKKEKVSKQEYLLWSKKLDRIRKEVEEG